MRNFGINARVLTKPSPGGVGRYTEQLLSELDYLAEDSVITAVGAAGETDIPDGIQTEGRAPAHSGFRAHVWEQISLKHQIDTGEFDLLHTPAGNPPVLSTTPLVTTIHDISPIINPSWFSDKYVTFYRILTPIVLRVSDRIITVSEFSKKEIIDKYDVSHREIIPIHNGVKPRTKKDGTPCPRVSPGAFLLFVGSMNPRKNLRGLIKAYSQYREQATSPLPLVLAGPSKDIFAENELDNIEGIINLGYVSEDKLTWLYTNAAVFVFPSLYEGFGLPIIEAMSVGTPVVTSDRGAMAEVAGDAAYLVDPTNVAAIGDGITRLLEDKEYRRELSERGKRRSEQFDWSKTARQTLDVYHEVVDGA
jgi:glycosyltransferase involved in cell wall biosynthesis